LAACRTMLQKYKLGDRCRLFVADGTTFSVIPEGIRFDSESCRGSLCCGINILWSILECDTEILVIIIHIC
jgi:hypothetical protein